MNVNFSENLPDGVNSHILLFLLGDCLGENVLRNGVVHIPEALEAIQKMSQSLQGLGLNDRSIGTSITESKETATNLLGQVDRIFPNVARKGFLKEDCASVASFLHSLSLNALNRALRQASMEGSCELTRSLISLKADVSRVGELQKTPLRVAIEWGREGVVDILLSSGANKEQKSQSGETPVFLAAEQGRAKVLSQLIIAGANLSAVNQHKLTPLHIAARYGHVDCVKLLLEGKAGINSQNTNKRTPLHLAARHGHFAVVKVLLEKGASSRMRDIKGQFPTWEAKVNGHNDIAQILKEAERNSSRLNSLLHCGKKNR